MRLVDDFKTYFKSRENVVGQFKPDEQKEGSDSAKIKGSAWTEKRRYGINDVREHIEGITNLGLSPLLKDNTCYWAAIDIDKYPFNIKKFSIKYKSLPVVPCRTKSGGMHLYFFFTKKQKALHVKKWLEKLVYLLDFEGLGLKNSTRSKIEVFPKQIKVSENAQANWISLPYFANGVRQYAVYKGQKILIDHFFNVIKDNLISNFEEDILNKLIFHDAPPCLQVMALEKVKKGNRDTFLFNTAYFLKQKYPDDWKELLQKINQDYLHSPMELSEIMNKIIPQHEKSDIFYQCKTALTSFCLDKECKTRKYGCGRKNEPVTLIGTLTKVLTNPVSWQIDVNGVVIDLDGTENLINQNLFRLKCVEKLHLFPAKMKQDDWEIIIQEKLENVLITKAPEDADVDAQFWRALKSYALTQSKLDDISQISRGKVYFDGQNNYFKSSDFSIFLKENKRIYNYPDNKIYTMFAGKGLKKVKKRINPTQTPNLWVLPKYPEQDETENLKVPDFSKHDDKEEF